MIEHENERRKLEAVASEYRSAGYDVSILPQDERLPAFLRGTQPDLVAVSPKDKVVVEVKVIRDLHSSPELTDLARRIEEQPGWRFELITVRSPREAPAVRPRWRTNEIASRLGEAKRLLDKGHTEAALLLAYAAVEAALFAWALSWGGVSAKQPTASAVAKRMVVSGALSHRDFVRFEKLSAKRNAAAHGVALPRITRADARALLVLGDRVLQAPHG